MSDAPKRILVCPLDWGLGHATRCIPVVRELIKQGAHVVIGADGGPMKLLKLEFGAHSSVEFVTFPGYSITYPKKGLLMPLHMAAQAPRLIARIDQERKQLQNIIEQHNIDGVISDNRFGLDSDNVPTVFMTHQVLIKAPVFTKALHKLNRQYIDRFTQLWIPDVEGEPNLSGDLSHAMPLPPHGRFIGCLSRLFRIPPPPKFPKGVLAIVSGPEPQRTQFADLLWQQLIKRNREATLVLGQPEKLTGGIAANTGPVSMIPHQPAGAMQTSIENARLVVARAGYSTIMDLATMNAKAVLVPTPGQTEQEYLARYHMERGNYFSMKQSEFDLETAVAESRNYSGIDLKPDPKLIASAVSDFLALT